MLSAKGKSWRTTSSPKSVALGRSDLSSEARSTCVHRTTHWCGPNSRPQVFWFSRVVSLAWHLLEQVAAHGKESSRRDRLATRSFIYKRFHAICSAARSGNFYDGASDGFSRSRR